VVAYAYPRRCSLSEVLSVGMRSLPRAEPVDIGVRHAKTHSYAALLNLTAPMRSMFERTSSLEL